MYIGEKVIDRVEGSKVYFVDGTEQEYTSKQLTYLQTEEEKDPSDYMNLVIANVMPEVQEVIDRNIDEIETVKDILKITMEDHNITQEQLQRVIEDIIANRVEKHNAYMKATVWDQITVFEEDMKRYKSLCGTLWDSHKRAVCIAVGKALGTYIEWEPFETFRNNISFSHIKKYL